ncbi:phage terminase large subunit [Rubrobacter calidifluminis]|uniref:phage terminase large subunit n=1 Tax=Rubrobacter calidifluminis TaxID=1392640 RepID=UPI00235E6331|nr:phage terminase large subunit [Rubrobacter calidifluminis]
MLRTEREVLFGGAAGPGKTSGLLMAALMFANVPGYSALIVRKTYTDLALPGAIMDRSHEWLGPTDAVWNDVKKRWTFPSGATLSFGYLDSARDHFRYQGMEIQGLFVDELTQIPENQYLYLLSRLRRLEGTSVPLRVRCASNPGGIGHDWVFRRFVKSPTKERAFIPARLDDNPYLDREQYKKTLENLDDITRQQLLEGLWVKDEGEAIFKREWFAERYDASDMRHRNSAVGHYIFWDTAYKEGEENDYSAASVFHLSQDYRIKLCECLREKLPFPELTWRMEELAERYARDGKLRAVVVEDTGAGTSALQTLADSSRLIAPYLKPFRPKGKKTERAREASVWARRGMVLLPQPNAAAPYLNELEEELFAFPNVEHDDLTDTIVMGILYLRHFLAEGARFAGAA